MKGQRALLEGPIYCLDQQVSHILAVLGAAYSNRAVINRLFINGTKMRENLEEREDLLKRRKQELVVDLREGRDLAKEPMPEW